MDGINAAPAAPTYLDRLLLPLPYLPWLVVAGLLLVVAIWALLRVVNRRLTPEYNIGTAIKDSPVAVAIFWGLILAAVLLTVGGMLERAAFGATDRYDPAYRRWTAHYFGDRVDWRVFKAQGMTESRLDPRVCSHVGACGLMQIMPGTARELGINPMVWRQAVEGGLRYMRWQVDRWTAPRPEPERMAFAFASYNAGLGNVLQFQRRALAAGACNANRYLCVEPYAWKEPREYVRRIARWCLRFRGAGCWPAGGGP